MANPPPYSDDYSPSSTLTTFTPPIPLLRIPIPIRASSPNPSPSPSSSPNHGPHVLAFPSPTSFLTSLNSCHSLLLEQCLAGARIGCSLSASRYCTPPWWKRIFSKGTDGFRERNECEEREMEKCLVGVRDKCEGFAKGKCHGSFGSARVRVRVRDVERLVGCVTGLGFGKGDLVLGHQLKELREMCSGSGFGCDVSYVRGSELMMKEEKRNN